MCEICAEVKIIKANIPKINHTQAKKPLEIVDSLIQQYQESVLVIELKPRNESLQTIIGSIKNDFYSQKFA